MSAMTASIRRCCLIDSAEACADCTAEGPCMPIDATFEGDPEDYLGQALDALVRAVEGGNASAEDLRFLRNSARLAIGKLVAGPEARGTVTLH